VYIGASVDQVQRFVFVHLLPSSRFRPFVAGGNHLYLKRCFQTFFISCQRKTLKNDRKSFRFERPARSSRLPGCSDSPLTPAADLA
jgi:hypothetical protein